MGLDGPGEIGNEENRREIGACLGCTGVTGCARHCNVGQTAVETADARYEAHRDSPQQRYPMARRTLSLKTTLELPDADGPVWYGMPVLELLAAGFRERGWGVDGLEQYEDADGGFTDYQPLDRLPPQQGFVISFNNQ